MSSMRMNGVSLTSMYSCKFNVLVWEKEMRHFERRGEARQRSELSHGCILIGCATGSRFWGFCDSFVAKLFSADDVWKEWVLEGRQLWASSQPWLWRHLAIPSSEFKSCSNFPLLPPMPIMGSNAWLWDDILMCCHPMSPKSGYV